MKISVDLNLDLWVARDKDGGLFVFQDKPEKRVYFWGGKGDFLYCSLEYIDIESLEILIPHMADYFDFSQVQWEDAEPKQLKDILIKNYE